jgi:hypothetical protein
MAETKVQWIGAMDCERRSVLHYGFVSLWVCGLVILWVCGFMGLWACGSVDLWVCGFDTQHLFGVTGEKNGVSHDSALRRIYHNNKQF